MRDVLLTVTLYPVFLGALVTIDRLTGWQIAEAFGFGQ